MFGSFCGCGRGDAELAGTISRQRKSTLRKKKERENAYNKK